MKSVRMHLVAGLVVISAGLSSCCTPSIPKKPTVDERIQFDRAIGIELAKQFEPQLHIRKDPALTAYLSRVGQSMADMVPELHLPSVDVDLITDPQGKWSSYALPGGKIYVATGIFKRVEFENEVAAILAIQLGHLQNEHALDYLRKNYSTLVSNDDLYEGVYPGKGTLVPSRVDYLGKEGLFDFTDKQVLEAVRTAVNIMYLGGYDPRGLVTVWRYHEASDGRSPYSPELLDKLLEATRTAIALHSPLRNPIVRTQAFMAIRRKFRKL